MHSERTWALAYPEITALGVIRQQHEDFVVEEVLSVPLKRFGAHWYIFVETRQWNTEDFCRYLAEALTIPVYEIGYAGKKDKRAVTRQWFSVPSSSCQLSAIEKVVAKAPRASLLESGASDKKLRIGEHRANRFEIRIRWQTTPKFDVLSRRLERVMEFGVPNYFGTQRFGYQGANVERARHWLLNRNNRGRRQGSGWHLSVMRSWFFNRCLSHLVETGLWHYVGLTEMTKYSTTWPLHAVKCVEGESTHRQLGLRLADGRARLPTEIAWQSWERRAYRRLRHWHFRPHSRVLKLTPSDFSFEMNAQYLDLRFTLPTGAFATAILRELGAIQSYRAPC